MKTWIRAGAAAAALMGAGAAHAITLEPLSLYKHGKFGASAAEIAAYDPGSKRLFVVNGEKDRIDVLDIADPAAPKNAGVVDLSAYGATPNSVALNNGIAAAAVTNKNAQAPGAVVFFAAADLKVISAVKVGPMPDMVTFTPDGRYVLTADEGEPDVKYKKDPEGSVSIIDVSAGFAAPSVNQATFSTFTWDKLTGVAPMKKGVAFAQDAEPEYIAVSADSKIAYVGLQEVNAVAVVDIASATVTGVKGLGFKDWSKSALDLADRDSAVDIKPWPVLGVYMPDAIAAFVARDGQTYLLTANEGDSKDFTELGGSFSNEARVGDLTLDPKLVAKATAAGGANFGGRLKVLKDQGDTDKDGDYDALYAFGARSISIWDANVNLVYDSGDALEHETARAHGFKGFNTSHTDNVSDGRSDDKGPEPEGAAIGVVDGRTYAFVGLERVSGIAVFDITDPKAASLVAYHNSRNFDLAPSVDPSGDHGPEGVLFIPAGGSPTGAPLLVVSNEIASTTRIYAIKP